MEGPAGFRVNWRGPLTPLGLTLAGLVFLADQLHKWWMLGPYAIAEKGYVQITPFFDLTLVWNEGVSYGLLRAGGHGQFVLVAVSLAVCLFLVAWLARARQALTAAALGLIIGGALGNAIDRATRGYVLDFIQFFVGDWHFAAFNVADMAITLGAGLMILDLVMQSVRRPHGEAG